MRRNLTEAEQVRALYMFYIEDNNLDTIAKVLDCSIYDLSPWVTSLATRICIDLKEKNPELHKLTKLLDDIDHVQDTLAKVKSNNNAIIADLLRRVRLALCHFGVDHETDKAFLRIADINYREVLDLLKKVANADIMILQDEIKQFLADESPTDTKVSLHQRHDR